MHARYALRVCACSDARVWLASIVQGWPADHRWRRRRGRGRCGRRCRQPGRVRQQGTRDPLRRLFPCFMQATDGFPFRFRRARRPAAVVALASAARAARPPAAAKRRECSLSLRMTTRSALAHMDAQWTRCDVSVCNKTLRASHQRRACFVRAGVRGVREGRHRRACARARIAQTTHPPLPACPHSAVTTDPPRTQQRRSLGGAAWRARVYCGAAAPRAAPAALPPSPLPPTPHPRQSRRPARAAQQPRPPRHPRQRPAGRRGRRRRLRCRPYT
jgi:hypothetical protein